MADFFSHRARALLIADPDTDPALVELAQDLLATGGTTPEGFQTTGPPAHFEEVVAATIEHHIDAVVVLRSELSPSREVLAAVRLARAKGKPVQALVVEGITPGINVDELHAIQADPNDQSWHGLQDLRGWAIDFPKRFGHPTH